MSLELSNLLEVPTLSKRFLMWDAAWTDISNRLIIGHGSNKTGLTILDNSYLMSIYRYGVIGLFLELSLYALIIRNCIRDNSSDWVAGLTLIFLSAFLVAGTTATVFYELKLPYIFMLLAGALSARPLGGGGLECVD
jgi:O-antigen ligase